MEITIESFQVRHLLSPRVVFWRKAKSVITSVRDPRPIASLPAALRFSLKRDEGIFISHLRDRMQTPKQRPLLPTSPSPTYLYPAMPPTKSLFRNNFRISPTRSRFCAIFRTYPADSKDSQERGGTSPQSTNHYPLSTQRKAG